MITFTCSGCGHQYKGVPDIFAGRMVRCKKCDAFNKVPGEKKDTQHHGLYFENMEVSRSKVHEAPHRKQHEKDNLVQSPVRTAAIQAKSPKAEANDEEDANGLVKRIIYCGVGGTLLLIIVFLIVYFSPINWENRNKTKLMLLSERIVSLVNSGEYFEASDKKSDLLTLVMLHSIEDPKLHESVSFALEQGRYADRMIDESENIVKLKKLESRARANEERKDYEAAIEDCQKALNLLPDVATNHSYFKEAQDRLTRYCANLKGNYKAYNEEQARILAEQERQKRLAEAEEAKQRQLAEEARQWNAERENKIKSVIENCPKVETYFYSSAGIASALGDKALITDYAEAAVIIYAINSANMKKSFNFYERYAKTYLALLDVPVYSMQAQANLNAAQYKYEYWKEIASSYLEVNAQDIRDISSRFSSTPSFRQEWDNVVRRHRSSNALPSDVKEELVYSTGFF
jgi:hypothetical protein